MVYAIVFQCLAIASVLVNSHALGDSFQKVSDLEQLLQEMRSLKLIIEKKSAALDKRIADLESSMATHRHKAARFLEEKKPAKPTSVKDEKSAKQIPAKQSLPNIDGYVGVKIENEKAVIALGEEKSSKVILMKTGKNEATFYGDLNVVGKVSSDDVHVDGDLFVQGKNIKALIKNTTSPTKSGQGANLVTSSAQAYAFTAMINKENPKHLPFHFGRSVLMRYNAEKMLSAASKGMYYTAERPADAVTLDAGYQAISVELADKFADMKKGPKYTAGANLFTGDGSDGTLRSTAQKYYSTTYEKGFVGDFYLSFNWGSSSEYGIFCLVLDNLSGFNPVQNSGGLYKRAIRNDRDQFYINHEKVFGDNAFSGYKSGSRKMEWYRVDGKTFVNCVGCKKAIDVTKWVGTRKVFPIFRCEISPLSIPGAN